MCNASLAATFRFIQQYQDTSTTNPSVYLQLKISLLENQFSGTPPTRNDADDFINGQVLSVSKTSVVIRAFHYQNSTFRDYTVFFCDLIYLISYVIEANAEAYYHYLCSHSTGCEKDSSLVLQLKETINEKIDATGLGIVLIFAGVRARFLSPASDFKVIKGLVIFQDYTVIPVNMLNGFGLIGICPQEEVASQEVSSNVQRM